jgi:pseudaminic acid synthase
MERVIDINGHLVGEGNRVYVVAEMSANHGGSIDRAKEIILAAKDAGADAVKLQTYTPATMTIDCDNRWFRTQGTIWEGRTLYDLYGEAFTPWEWQPLLKEYANSLGLDLFSTPFDDTAVDFLEQMNVPCHKVASFENVDLPLLRKVAATGRPVIMSTGMATLGEIEEAVRTLREAGCRQLAILHCTSAYPAPAEEMNLRTIPHMAQAFHVPVGLSDHTLNLAVPVSAVAFGACIIEKHFTLSRSDPGPDSAFSMEPNEFKAMVDEVRTAEKAVGRVCYDLKESEKDTRVFRRSLFVVRDVKKGEPFTYENVRAIRPGHGLHTRYLEEVLRRCAARDISAGTPLAWDALAPG